MSLRRPIPGTILVLLSASAFGGAALAQDASGCDKFKWSIARERSAFAAPGLPSVSDGGPLPGIAEPATVKLKPSAEAGFVRPPGRKPQGGTFGAALELPPIAVAGTYQVTLSDEAWIDVIQGGREVRSSSFSGQRDCPAVRKSVRFHLQPGDASLQISGAAADSIKVELLPAE